MELGWKCQLAQVLRKTVWHYLRVCAQLCPTPYDPMVAHQPPLFIGFFRQEYWSKLPFPTPGNLPNPGMEAVSIVSLALAGKFFIAAPPGKPLSNLI